MLTKKLDAFLGLKPHGGRRAPKRRRLWIESLESRALLSGTPIHVDTFEDVSDPADGLTSLREAIIEARDSTGDDRILLPRGHYLLAESQGQLEIDDSSGKVTIQSGRAAVDAQRNGRVFFIHAGSEVEIKGLTITGGMIAEFGGGIFNAGASLTLKNSHVKDNEAIEGGGIFSVDGAELTLKHSTVSNNTAFHELPFNPAAAPSGNGGGITSVNSSVVVINSQVNNNLAIRLGGNGNGGFGGGIISVGDGSSHSLSLRNSEVSGNSVNGGGGGIGLFSVGEIVGTLTLQNSIVSDNSAEAQESTNLARGGGIWTDGIFGGVNHVMLDNSRVTENQADNSGGGIWTGAVDFLTQQDRNDVVTLRNSRVTENEAGLDGGGIWNGGTLTLNRSRVSENEADNDGGGIWNGGTLTLNRSRINENEAENAGDQIFNAEGAIFESVRKWNDKDDEHDDNEGDDDD